MSPDQKKFSYMFAVVLAFAMIALILACAYYIPERVEQNETPVFESMMGF